MTTVTSKHQARDAVGPEQILQVASGFMASKHLFAAADLGVFSAHAEGPATLSELSERIAVPVRTTRICADAMVALGFLVRDGEAYRNSDVAAAFLTGQGSADMRPFLRFWDQISYPNWSQLNQSLRTSRAAHVELTAEEGEIFSSGVEAITAGAAHALAAAFDFSTHQRILDIGGGTGSFTAAALDKHPHLAGTVVEVEPVASVARAKIAAGPYAQRIDVLTADAVSDALPAGYDVFLVANLIHLLSPERTRELFRRLRAVAGPQARLLLVDFWTDPGHSEPAFAALMAGEFQLFSDDGDVYSEQEINEWLVATGWHSLGRIPLVGPQSLVVAEISSGGTS